VREVRRSDGTVVLQGENDDRDMVVVEAIAIAFAPLRGNARCACGASLEAWGWRCVATDNVELGCVHCHRVHGFMRLGVRVRY
jgi:hypothetical protein